MKASLLVVAGALALLSTTASQAQSPSPAPSTPALPALPAHTTNPEELPKIYAVGIRVADLARSERFYREAMGAVKSTPLTPRETAVSFPSGISINLVQAAPGSVSGEGPVGFIFQTLDIDDLVKRVVAAGGTVERQPSDGSRTRGVRVAFVRDPDGARIEVIQFPKE